MVPDQRDDGRGCEPPLIQKVCKLVSGDEPQTREQGHDIDGEGAEEQSIMDRKAGIIMITTGSITSVAGALLMMKGCETLKQIKNRQGDVVGELGLSGLIGGRLEGVYARPFPAIGMFHFALTQGQAVSVLIVEAAGGTDRSLYLRRALAVGDQPAFRAETRRINQLTRADLAGRSVVILDDAAIPSSGAA